MHKVLANEHCWFQKFCAVYNVCLVFLLWMVHSWIKMLISIISLNRNFNERLGIGLENPSYDGGDMNADVSSQFNLFHSLWTQVQV